MQAGSEIANLVRREAFVMAYSDCFFVIGVALALSVLALFLVAKPPGHKPGRTAGDRPRRAVAAP